MHRLLIGHKGSEKYVVLQTFYTSGLWNCFCSFPNNYNIFTFNWPLLSLVFYHILLDQWFLNLWFQFLFSCYQCSQRDFNQHEIPKSPNGNLIMLRMSSTFLLRIRSRKRKQCIRAFYPINHTPHTYVIRNLLHCK